MCYAVDMKKPPLLISACLAGKNCRYDANSATVSYLAELMEHYELIAVCPEQLGGLPTPRPCAELVKERVLTKDGLDLTGQFLSGAKKALDIAQQQACKIALLMERSPSCGSHTVYDGTFSGTLVEGEGVFAHMLRQMGYTIYTPQTLELLMKANTAWCESEPR